ncbi:hypothetical protein SARU107417_14090 [Salinibacter ruber]
MCPQAQKGKFRMDSLEQSMQLVFQLSSTANQFLGLSREGTQNRLRAVAAQQVVKDSVTKVSRPAQQAKNYR